VGLPDFKPTILIADAAEAITNGFESAFGTPVKRIMSFAHVVRNVDKHLPASIPVKLRAEIKRDIGDMQLLPNEEIFSKAHELFRVKWQAKDDDAINTFLDYFTAEWFTKQNGWYEGFTCGYPSHNNATNPNRYIKESGTLRERHTVSRFLAVFEDNIVRFWSLELDPTAVNARIFATVPELALCD